MFREMRRKKQALSEEECIEILINEPRGVLAVLGDDDYPYAVPLSHVYVDGKIYFHGTVMESHKRDAIEKHDKVSYCVIDKGVKSDSWWYTFKSVIVFGRMRTIEDKDTKIIKELQVLISSKKIHIFSSFFSFLFSLDISRLSSSFISLTNSLILNCVKNS